MFGSVCYVYIYSSGFGYKGKLDIKVVLVIWEIISSEIGIFEVYIGVGVVFWVLVVYIG